MKRALPALGLTAAGLFALLSYDTRDPVDELAVTGGAVVVIPTPADPSPVPTATPVPEEEPLGQLQPAPESTVILEPTPTTTPATPIDLSAFEVTVEGAVIETKYGPYQVVAAFDGGELLAVDMLQLPTGRKSRGITSDAIPLFTIDALETQSADGVELVSGATVAWEAYRLSLQAALDALAQAT